MLTRRVLAAPQQALAIKRRLFLDHDGLNPAMGAWAGADLALRMASAKQHSLVCPWAGWQVPAEGLGAVDGRAGQWASQGPGQRAGQGTSQGMGADRNTGRETEPPQALEKFLALWGGSVQKSGLRNRNLRAAPDQGWTLIMEEKV